jgi:hypothetical protein
MKVNVVLISEILATDCVRGSTDLSARKWAEEFKECLYVI